MLRSQATLFRARGADLTEADRKTLAELSARLG